MEFKGEDKEIIIEYSSKEEWIEDLASNGLHILKNKANGNCLFEAISQIINGGNDTKQDEIREEIYNFIQEKIEKLKKPSIKFPSTNNAKELLTFYLSHTFFGETPAEKNERMKNDGEYGELEQILAIAIKYKVNIKTYQTVEDNKLRIVTYYPGKSPGEETYMIHHSQLTFEGGHYEAILPLHIKGRFNSSSQESESESLIEAFYADYKELKEIAFQLKALGFTDQQIFKNLPIDKQVKEREIDQLVSRMLDERAAEQIVHDSQNKKTRKKPTYSLNSTMKSSPGTYSLNFSKNPTNQPSISSKKGHTPPPPPPLPPPSPPPPTSSMSAKYRFDDSFFGPPRPETPPFPKKGPKYTKAQQKPSNPKYTDTQQQEAVAAVMKQMKEIKEIKKEKEKKNKGGNKTKKRGRRYRSFRRT